MHVGTLVRLLVGAGLALTSTVAAADSMRCDGGIVSVGDSKLDLFGKCGPPVLQETEPIAPTSAVDLSMLLERWTYNFGPERFLQIVTLQGGKVVAIERGSYGYELPPAPKDQNVIPRARCGHDAFRVGDRTLDVLVKCGEPVFRDLRRRSQAVIEVWTYDFGQREFARFLEFENGKLTRIRTGSYGYSK